MVVPSILNVSSPSLSICFLSLLLFLPGISFFLILWSCLPFSMPCVYFIPLSLSLCQRYRSVWVPINSLCCRRNGSTPNRCCKESSKAMYDMINEWDAWTKGIRRLSHAHVSALMWWLPCQFRCFSASSFFPFPSFGFCFLRLSPCLPLSVSRSLSVCLVILCECVCRKRCCPPSARNWTRPLKLVRLSLSSRKKITHSSSRSGDDCRKWSRNTG